MRTAARELHDRRTAQAETLIVVPPPDQLPPHAPGVEIGNRRTFLREHDKAAVTEGQAGDLPQSRTYSEHIGLQGLARSAAVASSLPRTITSMPGSSARMRSAW